MSWSSNENEPGSPPVIFTSGANTSNHVLCDLWLVLDHMFQRQVEDRADAVMGLHAYINATNGYIDLSWLASETESVGDWLYTIRLPALHDASLKHPDGSSHFDSTCRVAVFCLSEDYDDYCEGERGLRPDNWGKGEELPRYEHPAHAIELPKRELHFYLSDELNTELEEAFL